MRSTLALALFLLLAGCAGCRENRDRAPTTSPTIGSSPMRPLGPAVMMRHEVLSISVREAIVRGDLGSARRNAVELGAVTVGGSPELLERSKDLSAAADAIAQAPDLAAAARATGAMVRTCGDCHARLTGPTRLEVAPPPPLEGGRRVRMRRHNWAMNRLWDGLVANSEEPWRAGAEVLADAKLPPGDLVPRANRAPEVEQIAASVSVLGQRALAASDTNVRSEIYGELLTTCADCHGRVR